MSGSNSIRKQAAPFTQVTNAILEDDRVSLKAKGLYSFMFSKPDNWTFHTAGLKSQLKEGEAAIVSGLNELIEEGWITRKYKRKDGKFAGYEYYFYNSKQTHIEGSHRSVVFRDGKTVNGKSAAEKQRDSNTLKSNTIKSKEREDFFSDNEKAINAYIEYAVNSNETIRSEPAYRRKMIDKFMREDKATLYAFNEWLPNYHAEQSTKLYKGKLYSVSIDEVETAAIMHKIVYDGGPFIIEFQEQQSGTYFKGKAESKERLDSFLEGGTDEKEQ